MNDDELNQAFDNTPAPDPEARRRAMERAMAEFRAVHKPTFFQGLRRRLRPTGDNNPIRTILMAISRQRLAISGLASVCVVALGILLLNHTLQPDPALMDAVPARDQHPAFVERQRTEDLYDYAIETRMEPATQLERPPAASPAPHMEEILVTRTRADRSAEPVMSLQMSGYSAREIAHLPAHQEHRDRFNQFEDNTVHMVAENPVSTFSVDVDTASYSFVRRVLNGGHLPTRDAVRVEEMINYFDYDYPAPADRSVPFTPSVVVVDSPWKAGNKLVHINIKGYEVPASERPRSNLVFLIDASGSMNRPDRMPLVKQSLGYLLDSLRPDDTVGIVTYAAAADHALPPTPVAEKQKILEAINRLQAQGSTAGAQGIQLAYQMAETHFDANAINRIVLATDGDFNVGHTGDSDLRTLVERKRDTGIYLSVLGFGMGNYQDAMMQTLSRAGNGSAAYIDTLAEAQKVMVHEASSMLFPIASDVKIQVEFNPATVAEYRLIGYETRLLNREDFNNDKVDAGDIGSGHTVTAIYEITPVGEGRPLVEPSRYRPAPAPQTADGLDNEYAFLRIRYKLPGEDESQLIEQAIGTAPALSLAGEIPPNSQLQEAGFATAVAAFGQRLRNSPHLGRFDYDQIIELAQKTRGSDDYGYRTEFVQLVRKAKIAEDL